MDGLAGDEVAEENAALLRGAFAEARERFERAAARGDPSRRSRGSAPRRATSSRATLPSRRTSAPSSSRGVPGMRRPPPGSRSSSHSTRSRSAARRRRAAGSSARPASFATSRPPGVTASCSTCGRVEPRAYRETAAQTLCYYAYFDGLPAETGAIYGRGRRSIGVWPTNDGLTIVVVFAPREELAAFRADVPGMFHASLDEVDGLGERVRAAARVERFYGSADSSGFFRAPYGPGWALVGDAGLGLDPITGQGITNAFRDAELLAAAIAEEESPLPAALATYAETRDRLAGPMYDLTAQIAALEPPGRAEEIIFGALARKPAEARRFLAMIAGVAPVADVMAPRSVARIVGLRGMARLALAGRHGRALAA